MKTLNITLITLSSFLLLGCSATAPKQETLKSLVAQPVPKFETGDISILGLIINKDFGGMPECKKHYERDVLTNKYKPAYPFTTQTTCFTRHPNNIENLTLGTETIGILIPFADSKTPNYVSGMYASLIDGKVQSITVHTRGLNYQDEISKDLIEKFGKPSSDSYTNAQNKFGANFKVRFITWNKPNGISISFLGALSKIDNGILIIDTEKNKLKTDSENKIKEAARPKI